jgi:hypothetical protein
MKLKQIMTLERQKDDGSPLGFEWFNCTPVRVNRKLQNNHPVEFRLSSAIKNQTATLKKINL